MDNVSNVEVRNACFRPMFAKVRSMDGSWWCGGVNDAGGVGV